MTAQPTALDLANAATRQAVADRQQHNYDEAQALADAALGPGYTPWMKLLLIPSDHRETGDGATAATAFKVYRGEQRLTENSVYVRRMPDDTVRHARNYEELFGDLLHEPHPTRTLQLLHGQVVPTPRWTLVWSALELYRPRSAESLAAAREKREEKAVEKEALANPLFSDMIRAEGHQPKRIRPYMKER